jgi:hypothetical protein
MFLEMEERMKYTYKARGQVKQEWVNIFLFGARWIYSEETVTQGASQEKFCT